ncbi:MAG: trypsin-like peptidase domain-containing protein [Acidobacteriota bacterium]
MSIQIEFADELALLATQLRSITVQVSGRRHGSGAGIIWRTDGLIITNSHVVPSTRASVELSDGRSFDAMVAARNSQRDLVALKIDADNLMAAEIGDVSKLRTGELVFAMGNPHGVIGALAIGVLHSPSDKGQPWIKADIRLAPGNSGGPLIDSHGRVIGINSMIAYNLAVAIPSNIVENFLQAGNKRPYLGLTVEPVRVSIYGRRYNGLLVLAIESGSAAKQANILIGDVLIGVQGRRFNAYNTLFNALNGCNPGDILNIDLIRGGQRLTFDVIVGSYSYSQEAA